MERRLRSVKIQAGKARRFLEDRERFLRLRGVLADNDLAALRKERQGLTFDLTLSGLRRGWMGQVGQHAGRSTRGIQGERGDGE